MQIHALSDMVLSHFNYIIATIFFGERKRKIFRYIDDYDDYVMIGKCANVHLFLLWKKYANLSAD